MKVRTRFYIFAAILVVFALRADLLHASWPEIDKLVASDGADNDWFGYCVSISGDYAIVGAYGDEDNGSYTGSAYIFKRDGTDWSEEDKLLASDGAEGDHFGYCVSISGDYAVVGAYGDDVDGINRGSAYIFKRDGVAWSQEFKLTASDGADSDAFGNCVSIGGDYAIVGALFDDDKGASSGSAYIFKRDGTAWDQEDKLVASDGAAYDFFGVSVSISGDYAVVGAEGDEDNGSYTGSAYIFKRDGTAWDQEDKLVAEDGAAYDTFGRSVSISGDYAVVGAYRDGANGLDSGSAYIFAPNEVDPNNWDQVDKLTASDGAAYDYFGWSVSVSGDYAVVGAYRDDANGIESGSAYIFKRDGTDWSQQAKLTASDGAVGDYFGYSVSVGGDYAIVGAYGDDDGGNYSGSAYMFIWCPDSDLTGDCFVDFRDLSVMGDEWLGGFK